MFIPSFKCDLAKCKCTISLKLIKKTNQSALNLEWNEKKVSHYTYMAGL